MKLKLPPFVWTAVALAAVPESALATDAPLAIRLEACPDVDRAQLLRLMRIELGSRLARSPDIATAHLEVRCQGPKATLTAVGLARDGLSRELPADDIGGEVGARVLALALIELLRDAEQAPSPAPSPSPPPSPPRPAPKTDPGGTVRLLASAQALSPALESPLWGATLSVDYVDYAPFAARLDSSFSLNQQRYALGRASTQIATLAAHAGYYAEHGPFSTRMMLGYRFGSARIAGESAEVPRPEAGTVTGAWGGPLFGLGLGLRLSSSSAVELGGEGGVVSFPVVGEIQGAPDISLSGYWLSIGLGIGIVL